MIWNKRFEYPNSQRSIKGEYDISRMLLPSVTTDVILSLNTALREEKRKTLDKWVRRVGESEADRIKNLAAKRGTAMHFYLQQWLDPNVKGYQDLTVVGQVAEPMAKKIIEKGIEDLTEVWGSEVTVHYPGLYAGATDLVCEHDGLDTVVDFKQSNRPKREEWIEDYYLQIAAYAMAHDYVYKSKIRQGIIMVCTPDCYYQEFKFKDGELRRWKHEFLKRLDSYYDLKKDYKEEAQIDTHALLAEFEKEGKK